MNSSNGKRFISLLKRIGYPDADKLHPDSFDWMFQEKDLKFFLKSLCSDITEDLLLTSGEVVRYTELVSAGLVSDDDFGQRLALCDNVVQAREGAEVPVEQIKGEINELKDDVTHTERYIRMLENQKKLLSMQQKELMEKIDDKEKVLKKHEKEISILEKEVLPEVVKQVKDAFEEYVQVIDDLNLALENAPPKVNSARAFFEVDFNPYIETEEKILNRIQFYLNNTFQLFVSQSDFRMTGKDLGFEIQAATISNQDVDIGILKQTLQISEEEYSMALLELLKVESQLKFCKDLIKKKDSFYKLPPEQLQLRYDQAEKRLKHLKQEESMLLQELPIAIKSKIEKQFKFLSSLMSAERLERYKSYMYAMQKPLEVLFSQKARLEFLGIAMAIEEAQLKNHIQKVQSIREMVESEVDEMTKAKSQQEEARQAFKPPNKDYFDDCSVYHAANEILSIDREGIEILPRVQDVLKKYHKHQSEEQSLIDHSQTLLNEQLNWIQLAENSVNHMEKLLNPDVSDSRHPIHVVEDLSSYLKRLNVHLQDFEQRLLKEMKSYQAMKKKLSQDANLRKLQRLYVYALTNQQKFENYIKDIKARKGLTEGM